MIDDEVVREVMNGMWFILSIEIWLSLIVYIVNRIGTNVESYCYEPTNWYQDSGTQLAIALLVYMTGSGLRAGWVWGLLECQNELGRGKCEYIASSVWVLYAASWFAIVGGLCTIRVLLPFKSQWAWLVAGLFAVVVPIIVHVA